MIKIAVFLASVELTSVHSSVAGTYLGDLTSTILILAQWKFYLNCFSDIVALWWRCVGLFVERKVSAHCSNQREHLLLSLLLDPWKVCNYIPKNSKKRWLTVFWALLFISICISSWFLSLFPFFFLSFWRDASWKHIFKSESWASHYKFRSPVSKDKN